MRKVIGITIAVFMLAGNLVGCGNSDAEESETATETSIETQAETEESFSRWSLFPVRKQKKQQKQ